MAGGHRAGSRPLRRPAARHRRQVEYVKLYAYYQTRRTPVLLHEVKYLAPKAGAAPVGTPLTGEHTVFSPHLEREMRYHCTLHEAAP